MKKSHVKHRSAHKKSEETGGVAVLDRREDFTERRNMGADRKTSDKIQPYDDRKGFDERLYDLRRGEIGNPAVPVPHALATAPLPSNQSTGLCVECGKGVAPAQNLLCRDHVRFG